MKKLLFIISVCLFADAFASLAGWQQVNGSWMYTNENNEFVTDAWVVDNGNWYYMDANGVMYADKSVNIKGNNYWFDSSGAMLHDTYGPDGVYINADGTPSDFNKNMVDSFNDYSDINTNLVKHDEYVNFVINKINIHRRERGLKEFTVSKDLCKAADLCASGSSKESALGGTKYESGNLSTIKNQINLTEGEIQLLKSDSSYELSKNVLSQLSSLMPGNRDTVEIGVGIYRADDTHKINSRYKIVAIGAGTKLTQKEAYEAWEKHNNWIKEQVGNQN